MGMVVPLPTAAPAPPVVVIFTVLIAISDVKCSYDLPALAGQECKKRFYREGSAGQEV